MRSNLSAVVWRLMIFAAVCLLGLFVLVAVFAQLRFGPKHEYVAEFTNIGGLKNGDIVRIAGVEVGKVADIAIRSDASVAVDFNVDETVQLTETSRAVIRFDNLYGDRYLTLEAGDGGGKPLPPGSTIPISRTAPALDLDTLIGGFRPLFRALDPEQVNALSSQLIQAFQGQGDAIGSVLTQSAALTNTLADRDELIGQLITNLNTVLGTLGDSNEEFGQAITETVYKNNPAAYNSIAWTIVEEEGWSQEAVLFARDLAEKACELSDWESPMILDTLAWAQFRAGDAEAAVKTEQKAIDMLSDEEAAQYKADFEKAIATFKKG